jgi:hypothetical protein
MNKLLIVFLFVLNSFSLNAQTNLSTEIEKLLPQGKCNVDVMGLAFPKHFLELAEKFQRAIATNKGWFVDYTKKNAKEGEPLPYNSQFGLTKREYEEFLSLGEKRTLEKTGSAVLQVRTNSSGYEFDGGATLPELTGLKIDLEKLTITTPFAVLKNPTPDESKGGPALGAFSGYQWEYERGVMEKGDLIEVSFLVGRQKETGRKFIYYKAGEMKATNSISDVRVVIFYDRKKE